MTTPIKITDQSPVFPCWLWSLHTETWSRWNRWPLEDECYQLSEFTHWHPDQPTAPTQPPAPLAGGTEPPENIVGTGFYRNAAPGTFGPSEWLDLLMACQDGRATCMRVMEYIERETVPVGRVQPPEDLLEEMTNKFLRWPLPESVCADLCAIKQGPGRVGTSLLSYVEALAMMNDVVKPVITRLLAAGCKEGRPVSPATGEREAELLYDLIFKSIDAGFTEEAGPPHGYAEDVHRATTKVIAALTPTTIADQLAAKDAEIVAAHTHMDKLREHRNELDAACHELEGKLRESEAARASLQEQLGQARDEYRNINAAYQQLSDAHSAALTDAERYRHLRANWDKWTGTTWHRGDVAEKLDAAVDASRAQEAKP